MRLPVEHAATAAASRFVLEIEHPLRQHACFGFASMTPVSKLPTLAAAVLALVLGAACATTGEIASADPVDAANAKWVHSREVLYRNLGWSSLDAHDQAEHDLAAGKSSPVDQPHLGRGPRSP